MVQHTEPTEVRQVISEQTSERCRTILEGVVNGGTGHNAAVEGYRIGGKTGSSQTLYGSDYTIVSFLGFAPADDPQVIICWPTTAPSPPPPAQHHRRRLVHQRRQHGRPHGRRGDCQILDYLDVEKQYTAEESAAVDVTTPQVTGYTVADAETRLSNKGLSYRTIGEGDVVTSQVPAANSAVPGGSTVILYLGGAPLRRRGRCPT